MKASIQFHALAAVSLKKQPLVSIDETGGPHDLSGSCEEHKNVLSLLVLEPRIVQLIA